MSAGEMLERAALETALDHVRKAVVETPDRFATPADVRSAVAESWAEALEALLRPTLMPVINATGVVVHTNLGRAPLAEEAIAAGAAAAGRYTPLEYDLEKGARGSRYAHAARWLTFLTGAEDALVVNNNAAAILVAVDSLAGGLAVVVSRGELIEIGGGFRVHDIVAKSGARVVEVGATNKTHIEDYERAIETHEVGAILKVHRSNFSVSGFVAEVGLADLCRLGERHGVPVIFDQGTGVLESLPLAPDEPSINDALADGAALVCASGDKLLGGPQAGLLCGGTEWIAKVRTNPLLRSVRVDKATLAGLEATLQLIAERGNEVPVRGMLELDPEELGARAEALLEALAPGTRDQCTVEPHAGRAGGGTLPGVDLPGAAVRVAPVQLSAAAVERQLRLGEPPIVSRVADDAVWLDVRTLLPGEAAIVVQRLDEILGASDN
jgi:L-seryl-tRNA(Ser) seleniumtransferase